MGRVAARLELHGLVAAVGLGAAALVHGSRTPDVPPVALLYVAAVVGSFLAADLLLQPADRVLLPLTSLLVTVGLVTVYRLQPQELAEQSAWACLGLAAALVCSRAASTGSGPLHGVAAVAALLVGASALPWVGWWAEGRPAVGLQDGPLAEPASEAAKVLVVLLAGSELQRGEVRGPVLLSWATAVVLHLLRGDVATGSVLVWVGVAVAYCATGAWRPLAAVAGGFAVLLALGHTGLPNLGGRLRAWVDPWADPLGFGYPLVQSLFALGSGGLAGAGPGFGYPELVPQAHKGFVLAAVGEEWGFVGVLGLLVSYAVWVGRALRAAALSPTRWGRLVACGATALVGSQAFLAAAGTTGLLPATGAPLPFVSHGGPQVALHLALSGIVLASAGPREVAR